MTTRRTVIPNAEDDLSGEIEEPAEPTTTELREQEKEIREDRDPLEEGERITPIIGDEFEEELLEEEEIRSGENRDVIQDIPGQSGNTPIIPDAERIPPGMETSVRGAGPDAEEMHDADEDEETGGDA